MIALLTAIMLAMAPAPMHESDVRQRAHARFDEGLLLVDSGDFAGAVVAFKEAYNLQPHPAVLLNLGQAYIALDRPREAVDALERYLRDSGAELSPQRRRAVEARIQLQRARVGQVASAPPPRPARMPAVVLPATGPPPAPATRSSGVRLTGALIASGGLVVAGMGAAFGLKARHEAEKLRNVSTYDPALEDGARRDRTLAYVLLGVGSTGVVVGGLMCILGHGDRAGHSALSAVIDSRYAGVTWSGTFR
jgi:tetratricopeptide (TPR) repeat protein